MTWKEVMPWKNVVMLTMALGFGSVVVLTVGRSRPPTQPSASSAPVYSARPEVLQLMTSRDARIEAFEIDQKKAIGERDRAIDYCYAHGMKAAMGFGMSVICVHAEREFEIHYPEYPVFEP